MMPCNVRRASFFGLALLCVSSPDFMLIGKAAALRGTPANHADPSVRSAGADSAISRKIRRISRPGV